MRGEESLGTMIFSWKHCLRYLQSVQVDMLVGWRREYGGEYQARGGRWNGLKGRHAVWEMVAACCGWAGETSGLWSGMEAWRGHLRPGHEASMSWEGVGVYSDLGKPLGHLDRVAHRLGFWHRPLVAVLRIGRGRPRVVGNEPVILVYFVSGDDRIFRWIGWGGG